MVVVTWRDVLPFAVGWLCGWLLCWRRLEPQLPGGRFTYLPESLERPALAVVIPARNEAGSLPALLGSLAESLRPGDEVVVVDDASTDGTAAVASAHGARVVEAPPLPDGWTGKASACATGVVATTAPVLVFLDADVTLEAGTLDVLGAQAAAEPDHLVSVQPWHRMERPYEQLSVPFNLVSLAGTGLTAPWGARVPVRIAFGPVLATTRAAYEAAGGHAHPDVRGSIVDDIALARRYDGRVRLWQHRTMATFRMYPDGVRQLVEGWTKNIATGAASVPWWAFVLTVGWLWSMVGAPAAGWPCWVASAIQVYVLGRRVAQVRWWAAPFAPLLALFFLAILARSGRRRRRGRSVTWRGRAVPTG